MRHFIGLATILSMLVQEARAQSSRLEPFRYMTLRTADAGTGFRWQGSPHDLEIDQSLNVDWDELSFFAAATNRSRSSGPENPVEARIAFLSDAIAGFVGAQAVHVEFRERFAALRAARRLRSADTTVLESRLREARGRLAIADSALSMVIDLETNSAFADVRDYAARLGEAVDSALLDPTRDYTPVGRVLEGALQDLAATLRQRAANGDSLFVFMSAWLHSGDTKRQLHLTGYDDFSIQEPMPFPRIRFSVDERTRRELESAEAMAHRLQNLDGLKAQVEAAVAAFRSTVDSLGRSLGSLNGELEQLRIDLERLALGPELPQAITRARQDIEKLLRFTPPSDVGGSDAAILIAFAGTFESAVTGLEGAAIIVGRRLATLEGDLRAEAPKLVQTRAAAVASSLKAVATSFLDGPETKALFAELRAIGTQLGVTQRVISGVGTLGEIGRLASPDISLDTSLDLLTAGERHPGDYLILTVRVQQADREGGRRTLVEQRQSFRLRALGFYLEPRGALLFADARRSDLSDQSYEPVVALSYVGHFGFRNFGFWNDVINPGLGVTFTLLDFDDDTDLEFGIGGTVTILRDLLLVGFGRNIPVKANFFYIGVNPLAFGDLLRLSRGGAGPER